MRTKHPALPELTSLRIGVSVAVGTLVAVRVTVLGGTGVDVLTGVAVFVDFAVRVGGTVRVAVGVYVRVDVSTGVAVTVAVLVAVFVAVWADTGAATSNPNIITPNSLRIIQHHPRVRGPRFIANYIREPGVIRKWDTPILSHIQVRALKCYCSYTPILKHMLKNTWTTGEGYKLYIPKL